MIVDLGLPAGALGAQALPWSSSSARRGSPHGSADARDHFGEALQGEVEAALGGHVEIYCRIQNTDIPRARRGGAAQSGEAGGGGGARWSAAGRGGAGWDGSGWMRPGRRRDDAPREKPSLLHSRELKKSVLDDISEARTHETLMQAGPRNTTGGYRAVEEWLTSSLSAGLRALFVPGC